MTPCGPAIVTVTLAAGFGAADAAGDSTACAGGWSVALVRASATRTASLGMRERLTDQSPRSLIVVEPRL
ncbi:hypothetical protein GCM10007231_21050 [Nocardioides daphniae]|uniref:Secreted protein n=1 Tax=Nocardioides daphniae TaxID=402297 RepID=A0ABQ1QB04_9ACTN|nr:hypothetical protein GCM10007231_21050 [Nocardioides daphniae]